MAENKDQVKEAPHVGVDDLEGTFTIKVGAGANLSLDRMADLVQLHLEKMFDQPGETVEVKALYGSVIHDGSMIIGKPKPPEAPSIDEVGLETVKAIQEAISTFQGREITEDVLIAASTAMRVLVNRYATEGRYLESPKQIFQLVKEGDRIQVVVMSGSGGYYHEVYRG